MRLVPEQPNPRDGEAEGPGGRGSGIVSYVLLLEWIAALAYAMNKAADDSLEFDAFFFLEGWQRDLTGQWDRIRRK